MLTTSVSPASVAKVTLSLFGVGFAAAAVYGGAAVFPSTPVRLSAREVADRCGRASLPPKDYGQRIGDGYRYSSAEDMALDGVEKESVGKLRKLLEGKFARLTDFALSPSFPLCVISFSASTFSLSRVQAPISACIEPSFPFSAVSNNPRSLKIHTPPHSKRMRTSSMSEA